LRWLGFTGEAVAAMAHLAIGRGFARSWAMRGRTFAPGRIEQVHDLIKFFRANPQALMLLLICLILGLGTFIAVMFGLVSSGSTTTTGQPEGIVVLLHAMGA
jgi:hypothetical protein